MYRKQANEFEACMQRAAQGKTVEGDLVPLVNTARSVSALYVPPPPRGLEHGRRQLMAEAARVRTRRRLAWQLPVFAFGKLRTAAVVLSLLVVLAILPGLTHAIASSVDGSPLYGLKVLGQEARLWLTNDPEAVADLQVSMAEEQLADIATSLEQGQSIDPDVAGRAGVRLSRAVQAVRHDSGATFVASRLRLMNVIQNTHRRITGMAGAGLDAEQEPLHHLMRQMERARQELYAGAGQQAGEAERAREGTPPDDQEFGPHGPSGSAPAAQSTPGAGGPAASDPGSASNPPGKQTGAGGPAGDTPTGTSACTPMPEEPGAAPGTQQGSDGDQEQPHGSDNNRPVNNDGQGQRGNDTGSRRP